MTKPWNLAEPNFLAMLLDMFRFDFRRRPKPERTSRAASILSRAGHDQRREAAADKYARVHAELKAFVEQLRVEVGR